MIGARIKEYRQGKGLKIAEFAKQIGISQGSLSDIENAKTKPSSETIASIVRNTDIDATWLLTGSAPTVCETGAKYQSGGEGKNRRIEILVDNYEHLSEEDKVALERMAFALAQSSGEVKKAG